MMPISYAAAVLSSLSDESEQKHSEKTIMEAIRVALLDDTTYIRRKELRNAAAWLYGRVKK